MIIINIMILIINNPDIIKKAILSKIIINNNNSKTNKMDIKDTEVKWHFIIKDSILYIITQSLILIIVT